MLDDINIKDTASKVFKTSDSPLKFFMILILVLAGVCYALITNSKLPAELNAKLTIYVLAFMLIIVILVSVLLIFFPKKLTFDKETHLTAMREKLGDSELPYTYDDTDVNININPPEVIKSKKIK